VATEAKQPQHFTSKMVINLWAVLCLAFMASYTANLGEQLKVKLNHLKMKDLTFYFIKNSCLYDNPRRVPELKRGPR